MNIMKNIIDFPKKNEQLDNHHRHTINRGDGVMTSGNKAKQDYTPVVRITLVNHTAEMQATYSKKFMTPLIEGLLKRTQLAQAK
ncbi:hypothetical protein [Dendrosporobacter sp. 1207_IL3150]|uniref:hypothetical protein n=1 Tax=Dendrosporobacter sp. 1207_IL3150 TaxID=3084054 RepID=UPI002FDA8A41